MKYIYIKILVLSMFFTSCSKTIKLSYEDLETHFLPNLYVQLSFIKNNQDTINIYCAEINNKYEQKKENYYEFKISKFYTKNQNYVGNIEFYKSNNNYSINMFGVLTNSEIEFFPFLQLDNDTLINVYKITNIQNKNEQIYFDKYAIYYIKNEIDKYKLSNVLY